MNRRLFLGNLAIGSAALALFSNGAQAQVATPKPPAVPVPGKPVKVNVEILNNHGHAAVIPYEAVIIGNKLTIDIKGTSSHPHTILLSEQDLTILRQKLVVDVKSSVDAGHSHDVRITRNKILT